MKKTYFAYIILIEKDQKLRRIGNLAFTLIEISIALVIIGLLAGAILVGQDLIKTAQTRAQISQIERYKTAVSAFALKYNYLPGDIADPYATRFGFQPRGSMPGQGDGNGVLEVYSTASCHYGSGTSTDSCGWGQSVGENAMFWVDLSKAQLINETFSTADPINTPGGTTTGSALDKYIPQAKLGGGNYIYVMGDRTIIGGNKYNFYGIAKVIDFGATFGCPICQDAIAGMTVAQAYYMDNKIDDGLPQAGNILARLSSSGGTNGWAIGGGLGQSGTPDTSSTPGSNTTCYDNNATNNAVQHYSLEINSGYNLNCTLAIAF